MSAEQKSNVLVNLIKKVVGLPVAQSNCCGTAVQPGATADSCCGTPTQPAAKTDSCCGGGGKAADGCC